MTIFRISLLFAIPGAKALPLSTKLPTQEEWATRFSDWERKNWQSQICDESSGPSGSSIHPGSSSGITPSGRLCKSPADTTSPSVHVEGPSSPSIHPDSASGRPPATPPSQTPVDATSPSVGLPSTHKDVSLIPGGVKDPTDASRFSVVALEASKWLEYLSRHAKYSTFCDQYQQTIEKKRAELTQKFSKVPKEIDRGLRYYQRDNFRRHHKAGIERKKKLQAAIQITPNELQDLEEWERLGHDDEKDSALQKKLKEEEQKYQVQAIAVDPINPMELTHDEIEKLKIIFRMERKREIMAPDLHSSWAKWQPEKSTVKREDLDLYLDRTFPHRFPIVSLDK
ncbi:hypothetical protein H0H93_010436 [Arthromyces matolae]|nr:hypothetical protein H0H93_010436 [Arthromyces matolae]